MNILLLLLLLFIEIWILCGILAAGISFAYWQGAYSFRSKENKLLDLIFSLTWGLLFGPIFLIIAFIGSGFAKYGWRLK